MRKITIIGTIFLAQFIYGQNDLDWDGKYLLQQSDFQSKATQIGNTQLTNLSISSGFDFEISMSNFEFMFTKNFNSKVNNIFKRSGAAIVAPDVRAAQNLIAFAQFQFNLSELYARKLRKKLSESKGTFSNISFIKPIYEEIQNQYSERITNSSKQTEMGLKKEQLNALNKEVFEEIESLNDFCKDCKISKKKK